jgi:hypothetical protein
MSAGAQRVVYQMYNKINKVVNWPSEIEYKCGTPFLNTYAQYVQYVVIDGQQIVPVLESQSTTMPAKSAIVKVTVNGCDLIGEVLHLFYHKQLRVKGSGTELLAKMHWLSPLQKTEWPLGRKPWDD